MVRRWFLAIPLLAVAAAAAGLLAGRFGWLVVAGGGLAGALLAAALERAANARARAVADRVLRFADGDTESRLEVGGSREWRRLLRALNAVGASLQRRFDELADERARVERLLENLPIAVMLFGDDGLAYANPVARLTFALDGHEGRTPLQALEVQGLADAVAETAETGRTLEVEVEHRDHYLVGHTNATADGEVALAVTDLTEVRRVQAVRRDFVTNASHELKTPVAGILALSDSLAFAQQRDPERARTMLRRLQLESERLAELVRDLLDLSRLEESEAPPDRRRVDLAGIVGAQLDRLGRSARERGVKLLSDCPEPAPLVASPGDLRLIVANLLENAVRYNRAGGEVRVSVRRVDDRVELTVADTGVGIPEADIDRVFERFYRIDKARTRAAGGTGLGLAIVRHAVQRHGGEVSVQSVLGQGTTFRVSLPVATTS